MKYSLASPPGACFMRQSSWYNGAGSMTPLGVLWHDTAGGNKELRRYVQPDTTAPDRAFWLGKLGVNQYHNSWNERPLSKGVNAFIGAAADGEVMAVQVGPWTKCPWGVGAKELGNATLNSTHIQFEICDDYRNGPCKADYFEAVYREGVELTAYLCKLYGFDPHGTLTIYGKQVPVITSHSEAGKLGVGSEHDDPLKWFARFGRTMDDVRRDVAALLAEPPAAPMGLTDEECAVIYQRGKAYFER